ncbi:unnamed protein product [Adineta steineri]|uniref:C-type lectin domain-containing protein n=1 Tax=Adineta steineri TaxID=433720 RepID=A0A813MRX5_9BILA|nr:unnamed protein product [Adineta steineri]CAF0752066.1 unnamed protein product [Adineta steineri]
MGSELLNLTKFLDDEKKDNLVVYELEFNKIDNPNEKLRIHAKSQGRCACRLWLILFLVNFAIITLFIFLLLLLLIEVGPAPPYQTYGKQCAVGICDSTKGLECRENSGSKICQCPSDNWFWYNNAKCRECPSNWIVSNNGTGCYFVSSIQLNFVDANLWCMKSQGRLIEISNQNIFLTLQLIQDFHFNLNYFYWIGLREIGPNKNIYRWITSQTLFSNSNYFCAGQPLHTYNYYFQEYDQCIGLYIQSNTSSCLRDSTCDNVSPFICELCSYMI